MHANEQPNSISEESLSITLNKVRDKESAIEPSPLIILLNGNPMSESAYQFDSLKLSLLKCLRKWAEAEGLYEIKNNSSDWILPEGTPSGAANNTLKQETIALHHQGKVVLLRPEQINYIRADNSYSVVYASPQRFCTARSLKKWQELLEANNLFIRANKSVLINKDYCSHYVKGRPVSVILKNGEKIILSRRRQSDVLKKLRNK